MIVYEVNLEVDHDVKDEYLAWLRPRIQELLGLEGFEAALFYRPDDFISPETGRLMYTLHYLVRSQQHLNDYFENHAPRLRSEGMARYGGRFTATRRILQKLEAFEPE